MSGAIRGLDAECPTCGRIAGDHTMREWAACFGKDAEYMPFEESPEDAAKFVSQQLSEGLGIGGDVIVADNVVVRAVTLDASTGPVGMKLPAILHEFAVALPGRPPQTVAKVLFLGEPTVLGSYAQLVFDSAVGASRAARGQRAA